MANRIITVPKQTATSATTPKPLPNLLPNNLLPWYSLDGTAIAMVDVMTRLNTIGEGLSIGVGGCEIQRYCVAGSELAMVP